MIRQKLFENFAHPRGLWGRLAGQDMARKPANRERGRCGLTELEARTMRFDPPAVMVIGQQP